jgi:threonine aldolase
MCVYQETQPAKQFIRLSTYGDIFLKHTQERTMLIDVSSDNVTQPTNRMRAAMAETPVRGYGVPADEITARLESRAAEITGKEAALLMPTGTQANLTAILCQAEPSEEVILGPDSHLYEQELGGAAFIGSVMVKTWERTGVPTLDILEQALSPHFRFPTTASPVPALVCLEIAHNAAGGTLVSTGETKRLCETIHEAGLRVHLDGARIFNAAAALEVDVKELTKEVDTLMFSLDKGLSAPFGAMLCGPAETIEEAKRFRRMLGGFTRKTSIYAAAGLDALERMVERIGEDNQRAASLGGRLNAIEGLCVRPFPVPTNLVMLDISAVGVQPQTFLSRLEREHNVRAHIYGRYIVRFAIHRHIGEAEEAQIATAVERLVEALRSEA